MIITFNNGVVVVRENGKVSSATTVEELLNEIEDKEKFSRMITEMERDCGVKL